MEAIEDTVEDNGHVMGEHVIEVTDLRRSYRGGFEAVRGITFSVGRGEILALLGTNGAGKTSTVGWRASHRRAGAGCGYWAAIRTGSGPPYGRAPA